MTADKQTQNKQQQVTVGNGHQETIQPNSVEAVKKSYGENFQPHLLEQYKLYVEMMDRVSARRGQANTFYISLLSGLLALLSLIIDKKLFLEYQAVVLLATAILGLVLCYVWYANINSYKQLNSLKFKVINEIEPYLPFPCYLREWEILKEENKSQQYRRLTKVEKYVPFILAIPYLCLLVYSIYRLLI
ncbi:RipA family octameric membrane protein [Lyngbya aestuarii]|uniref:RipA family octameric membrane protein n=1 Tax=Lyngbya aestuarii TaxID=118322 RepID=UPI00403DE044